MAATDPATTSSARSAGGARRTVQKGRKKLYEVHPDFSRTEVTTLRVRLLSAVLGSGLEEGNGVAVAAA